LTTDRRASYRQLDGELVLETIQRLRRRIEERFPQSGLRGVAAELASVAELATHYASDLRKPIWPIRLVVWAFGLLLLIALSGLLAALREFRIEAGLVTALQGLESSVNLVVFIGAAFVFLRTREPWVRRRRALAAIHELRSLVHIVDMHQLLKDPEIVLDEHTPTDSSPPERVRNRFELARYLDYCSEMLSLSGKVAALYAQYLDDHVVLAAVTEVESLATGISGKIWQKIVILDTVGR
jgi:hypothetical protein